MMNNQNFHTDSSVTISISLNGFEFDYLDDRWVLNRNVTVNTAFLSLFKKPLADDLRSLLVYFAETTSPHYVKNITDNLKLYLKLTNKNEFSESGLISFKNLLGENSEYKLAVLRTCLRQMRYLDFNKHIDKSIYELTDQWSLSGNKKGIAVLSLCPETGPFSDMEFEAICFNSAHKFSEGTLTVEEYTAIILFKATGRRSVQLASLKQKDFEYSRKHTATLTYIAEIPKAKQRGGKFRSALSPFALTDSNAKIIESHIEKSTNKVESLIGRKLTSEEKNELPIFLTDNVLREIARTSKDNLADYLKSELSHITSASLTRLLIDSCNKLKVVSERTGRLLNFTGYRFRYTIGTRAAREGAGILTIARLLDHSDTQNVHVYVQNIPEFAIEISKIMNQPLAQYASAFAGKVVRDESEANKENKGATRIPCREKDCDVGSCGSNSFCQDYAPIACYLCSKFRPWAKAPHHLVLEWLIDERKRLQVATNQDMEIVAINDRAIIAVCQVIKLCKEYNHE